MLILKLLGEDLLLCLGLGELEVLLLGGKNPFETLDFAGNVHHQSDLGVQYAWLLSALLRLGLKLHGSLGVVPKALHVVHEDLSGGSFSWLFVTYV